MLNNLLLTNKFLYICSVLKCDYVQSSKAGEISRFISNLKVNFIYMEPLKVDRTKLITPSEYAKMLGVTKAAVTKMMNEGRVKVIHIKGARLIYLQ